MSGSAADIGGFVPGEESEPRAPSFFAGGSPPLPPDFRNAFTPVPEDDACVDSDHFWVVLEFRTGNDGLFRTTKVFCPDCRAVKDIDP